MEKDNREESLGTSTCEPTYIHTLNFFYFHIIKEANKMQTAKELIEEQAGIVDAQLYNKLEWEIAKGPYKNCNVKDELEHLMSYEFKDSPEYYN